MAIFRSLFVRVQWDRTESLPGAVVRLDATAERVHRIDVRWVDGSQFDG